MNALIAVVVAIFANSQAFHNPRIQLYEIRERPGTSQNGPEPVLKKLSKLPTSNTDTDALTRYLLNQVESNLSADSSSESYDQENRFVDRSRNFVEVVPLSTDYTDYVVERLLKGKNLKGSNSLVQHYKLSPLLKGRPKGLKRRTRDADFDGPQWDIPKVG